MYCCVHVILFLVRLFHRVFRSIVAWFVFSSRWMRYHLNGIEVIIPGVESRMKWLIWFLSWYVPPVVSGGLFVGCLMVDGVKDGVGKDFRGRNLMLLSTLVVALVASVTGKSNSWSKIPRKLFVKALGCPCW